jgi:hypothetical protein
MRLSKIIKGYIYQSQEDAISAVEKCNDFYNIVPTADNTTTSWVSYNKTNYNSPSFYYITWDKSLTEILGEPEDLTIHLEEENNQTN